MKPSTAKIEADAKVADEELADLLRDLKQHLTRGAALFDRLNALAPAQSLILSGEPPKPGKKVRFSALPASWTPTPEHLEYASKNAIDVDDQALLFRRHAETNDRRCARWNSAFQNWMEIVIRRRGGNPAAEIPARTTLQTIRPPPADEPPEVRQRRIDKFKELKEKTFGASGNRGERDDTRPAS